MSGGGTNANASSMRRRPVTAHSDTTTPNPQPPSHPVSLESRKTPIRSNPYHSGSKNKNGSTKKRTLVSMQGSRKRATTRILTPSERAWMQECLPLQMNSFDRFFAALLRSPITEYTSNSTANTNAVWKTVCRRVGLESACQHLLAATNSTTASNQQSTNKAIIKGIQPIYEDAQLHFDVRAALVLEEARHAIAQGLEQCHRRGGNTYSSLSNNHRQSTTLLVTAKHVEKSKATGHTRVTFWKTTNFNKDELFHVRPGTVFGCVPRDDGNTSTMTLGVIQSGLGKDQLQTTKSFTMLFCASNLSASGRLEQSEWRLFPVASLISELRCFEAMTMDKTKIGFLPLLLHGDTTISHRGSTIDAWDVANTSSSANVIPSSRPPTGSRVPFYIPKLNASQERVADTFIHSKENSITLCQGPPGTGKTSMVVSIMCRYLLQDHQIPDDGSGRRRLMVCAPTNKAISVLASRFLTTLKDDAVCNIVLVGDSDKLLVDEISRGEGNHQRSDNLDQDAMMRLRTIFVYSWMEMVIDDYHKIRSQFDGQARPPQNISSKVLYKLAKRLEKRLCHGFPDLPSTIVKLTTSISKTLESFKSGGKAIGIVPKLDRLISLLSEIPADLVPRELLASADVIFCTLATAGGVLFKNTARIHDLIVDEAAAATEPEICIPFQLQPTRLLAVGDPMQLPATVLSRKAIELGLAKSLHERLMFQCNHPFTMLDCQYRMRPEISAFPSSRFYRSLIQNGENVLRNNYRGKIGLLNGRPYTFLQVTGKEEQIPGGSYRNHMEARTIVDLILQLQTQAQSHSDLKNTWHSVDRVRVITFYQAQVGLIKRMLHQKNLGDKIVISTVDSSQGCEADIVLVSFVRSQGPPSDASTSKGNQKVATRQAAGFLTDDRRLNVSLTRAKYQLICIGNANGMEQLVGSDSETLRHLVRHGRQVKAIQPYPRGREEVNAKLEMFYGPPQKKRSF